MPSSNELKSPASAVGLSILTIALLFANVAGIFERPDALLAGPKEGVVSDTIRLLVFFAAGILATRLGKGVLTAALWALGLGLLDKTFVALRVGWIAEGSVPLLNLFLGATAIYVLTAPILIIVACTGYYSAKSVVASPEKGRARASALLTSALCAFVVYFVFALNSYLLLWIADFPIFYLSLSQQAVAGLFYACVGVAVIALLLWLSTCVTSKQAPSWPRALLGGLFLSGAVAVGSWLAH
jgi:hypothetical protein